MAKKPAAASIQASVLAFERKLDPSDALFHAGGWEDRGASQSWPPVAVREKSVRTTHSNRPKGPKPSGDAPAADSAKADVPVEDANLQTMDVATLPALLDTLRVRFSLRVLGSAGTPAVCNSPEYRTRLAQVISSYVDAHGFTPLAARYAYNLAAGRFLWRNRLGAEQIEVRIRQFICGVETAAWTFDALSLSLRAFDSPPPQYGQALHELATAIAVGLAGESVAIFEVTAFARVGPGQEVYPSQELTRDPGDPKKGKKGKTLYAVASTAAMHSQKIGNAIRTIDTWYPDHNPQLGPIPVEPYGAVTSQGQAYRHTRTGQDFYTLLDGWVLNAVRPAVDQQHFFMATLIRGGVFGASERDRG